MLPPIAPAKDTKPEPEPETTASGEEGDEGEWVVGDDGLIYYVVQAGETPARLAQRFNTTVEALAAANKLSDANEIKAGARLLIPIPE